MPVHAKLAIAKAQAADVAKRPEPTQRDEEYAALNRMQSVDAEVQGHDISRASVSDRTEAGRTGEGIKIKAKVSILGSDLDAANDTMKLITADAAKAFADSVTDAMVRVHRKLDGKASEVGTEFGTKLCDNLVRPKEALRMHADFVKDTRHILVKAVRRLAEHEAEFLQHIREKSGQRLSELVRTLVERQTRTGRGGEKRFVFTEGKEDERDEEVKQLHLDKRRLEAQVAKLKEQTKAADFAFEEADRARAEKMKAIRAINGVRANLAEMTEAHKEKESQLHEVNKKAESLELAMNDVVTQVDQLEKERSEMQAAVESIKSVTEERDMKALKTGQLVGKLAAKLHAKVVSQAGQTASAKQAHLEAQTQMAGLLSTTSIANSVLAVSSAKKFMRKMKNRLAITRSLTTIEEPPVYKVPGLDELAKLSKADRDALFRKLDASGNGSLSMGETRSGVTANYPDFDNPKAIKQAYKAADKSGDGAIGRNEFQLFLDYLLYFTEMWEEFKTIDADHDGRLSIYEFRAAAKLLGDPLTPDEVESEFAKMDDNKGGYVTFDEFASWAAIRAKETGRRPVPGSVNAGQTDAGAGAGAAAAAAAAAAGEFAYPEGISRTSTAAELQAMVDAGAMTTEQMVQVLAMQQLEKEQEQQKRQQEEEEEEGEEEVKAKRVDWLMRGVSSGVITRENSNNMLGNWAGTMATSGGVGMVVARGQKGHDQASQCNLGGSMDEADDVLRKARKKQQPGGSEPAGRWVAGFWVPEPWRGPDGISAATNSAVMAVSTKLSFVNRQTAFSARDGRSRSDGGGLARAAAGVGGSRTGLMPAAAHTDRGARRRHMTVKELEPRSDSMPRVPKPPPGDTRRTYHQRTGTPRLPLLPNTQLVNEEIAVKGPPATVLAGQMGVQVTRGGTGPPPTPPGQGPWIDHINALNRRPRHPHEEKHAGAHEYAAGIGAVGAVGGGGGGEFLPSPQGLRGWN